jgi:hypothetical protein
VPVADHREDPPARHTRHRATDPIAHDPDYANYVAMQKLVQAVGRGMRAPDDWCETLIVDDQFSWFVKPPRA